MYRKRYWLTVLFLFLVTTLAVGFIGGAATVYWSKTAGTIVIFLIIFGGWVGYKKLSRAYHEGRLFDENGRLLPLGSKDATQSEPRTPRTPHSVSKKDAARIAEIERKRNQAEGDRQHHS